MTIEHRIGRLAALAGLILILGATLTPIPGAAEFAASTPFWCLVCGSRGGIDVILNVALFLPFAIGLRLAGQSRNRVMILSALLSIFVEMMQLHIIPGRDASLSDLLTNTMGGVIGALLAPRLRTLLFPRPWLAAILAACWATGWLLILASTAWLLHPWGPTSRLRAGWGIRVPGYNQFSGRVLAASASDVPLYPGTVSDSGALHHQLSTGQIELNVHAIVGPQSSGWSPILALLGPLGMVAAVFEARNDIILELPTNADKMRFRGPALRLEGGRPPDPGEPVHVAAGARAQTFWIASSYGGEQRYRVLRLSPTLGWSLLLPFEYAFGPEIRLLTGLWIAGLLLPLGYWARQVRLSRWSRNRSVIVLALTLAAGLGLVPWLTGYPPVHLSEWIAGIIGLTAGWAVASRATYLAGRCASPSTSESYSS